MIAGHDNEHRWANRMAGSTGGDWVCSRCGAYRGARGAGPPDEGGCPGEPPHTATTAANQPTTDPIYLGPKSPTETSEPWAGNKPVPEEQEHPRFRRKRKGKKKDKSRGERKQELSLQRQLARRMSRKP